jgi:hypothetical protein
VRLRQKMFRYSAVTSPIERFDAWSLRPIGSSVGKDSCYVFLLYAVATLFDISTAFIAFRVDPQRFVQVEWSQLMVMAFCGSSTALAFSVFCLISPALFLACYVWYSKRKHGCLVNGYRLILWALWMLVPLKILGAGTNIAFVLRRV